MSGNRGRRYYRGGAVLLLGALWLVPRLTCAADLDTYHYDTSRTGWNASETTLTPANVGSGQFGLLGQIALDQQVDAEPLVVSGLTSPKHPSPVTVVYVATEADTIYAINAANGHVLGKRNFGPAVPKTDLPGQCYNNSDEVGINSTPVIDPTTKRMYFIAYNYINGTAQFNLHAISLTTLRDVVPPVTVAANGTLDNGQGYAFNATYQRQRSALLLSGGNVYAGFSSWCDGSANLSHGWVLGWNAGTLSPLAASELVNQRASAPNNFFLSSVWMSGYGVSADANGSVYFTTGNSDSSGQTYNPATNLEESVVKLSPDLSTVQGYFTPSGNSYGYGQLDKADNDFGAGGVMLLPDQAGATPHLLVAAGKIGPLYLLNRDSLPGLDNPANMSGTYDNPGCWCGPSYFVGGDNVPRVVTSAGNVAQMWAVSTSSGPSLTLQAQTSLSTGQAGGFFTSISSNGTTPNTAIVWAVTRPTNTTNTYMTLVAMDPANNLTPIFSANAGTWPFASQADSNTVPAVSGGRVYVASYESLAIFGLVTKTQPMVAFHAPAAPEMASPGNLPHRLSGIVVQTGDHWLRLRLRDGSVTTVPLAPHITGPKLSTVRMQAVTVAGTWHNGRLVGEYIMKAMPQTALWLSDQ